MWESLGVFYALPEAAPAGHHCSSSGPEPVRWRGVYLCPCLFPTIRGPKAGAHCSTAFPGSVLVHAQTLKRKSGGSQVRHHHKVFGVDLPPQGLLYQFFLPSGCVCSQEAPEPPAKISMSWWHHHFSRCSQTCLDSMCRHSPDSRTTHGCTHAHTHLKILNWNHGQYMDLSCGYLYLTTPWW